MPRKERHQPSPAKKETLPSPEQRPLLPPTTITIILAPHTAAEHGAGLRQHLTPGTIFIPELSGWDAETLALLQRVAQGESSPALASAWITSSESRFKGFINQLTQELAGTQVQVALVDTQRTDKLHQAFDSHQQGLTYSPDFAQTLSTVRAHLQEYLKLQHQREELMVERLLAYLANVAGEQHQVVMTLGAFHTAIADLLQRQRDAFASLTLNVVAQAEQSLPSFDDEASELVKANQHISDELAARVLLEKLILGGKIEQQLFKVLKDGIKVTEYTKQIVAQFNQTEIKTFYAQLVALYQQRVASGEIVAIGTNTMLGLNWLAAELLLDADTQPGLLSRKNIVLPQLSEYDEYRAMYDDFQG